MYKSFHIYLFCHVIILFWIYYLFLLLWATLFGGLERWLHEAHKRLRKFDCCLGGAKRRMQLIRNSIELVSMGGANAVD